MTGPLAPVLRATPGTPARSEIARLPRTCGQRHLGPDHSQIEIYEESKHGVMFQRPKESPEPCGAAARTHYPRHVHTHLRDLPHERTQRTEDDPRPTERLSWYLTNVITTKPPNYALAQAIMKQVCSQCHTMPVVERVYNHAEKVIASTNTKGLQAQALMDSLRKSGALAGPPFSHPIDFTFFDMWHYEARTSKLGAFMGSADFVQWHGNYPMLHKMVELNAAADELRKAPGLSQ
jgi:hypothetical protein